MTRRRLPIGIQTFREIREEDCYYVDKTAYMRRLTDEGKHYFLSRPRRFGKSLFLDTLKELFEGNRPLFEGLAAHDRWDWSVRYPVVRLDFSRGDYRAPGYLHQSLMAQLDSLERQSEVASDYTTGPERFGYLLEALHKRIGQRVAVLVDEYDKPILDALDTPEVARANRDYLRGVYSTVKSADAHVKFTFLLFEFKVVEMAPEGAAMDQLKRRCYADKYRGSGQPIWLVGVEFSRESRNLAAFDVERA